jgi:hypothetical protein
MVMTATVFSVLLSFVLVTVIGGVFAQRLQHRNWIRQQHIASQDKLITELKSIFVELDNLMSRRVYRTRRLLYALRRFDTERLSVALKNYDAVISEWNEKRNSFQIRLVRVVSVPFAQDFEHDLSRRFIRIGSRLERLTREAFAGNRNANVPLILTDLEMELDWLSRSVFEFLRAIYIRLQAEQEKLYLIDISRRIPDDPDELGSVSTWFLIKSLFVPAAVSPKES